MIRSKLPLAAAVAALSVLPAQEVADAIAAARRPFAMADGVPSGGGADFVLARARAAEFTVIGESHGNVETCRLTRWLLDGLTAHGYSAFATETGPCTTEHLAAIARDHGRDGVVGFVRELPFAIAFLHLREEAELFADAVALGYEPWGLDQEFLASGRLLLRLLAERARSEAARQLAGEWRERAAKGFEHFAATGDRSQSFMATVRPDDWRALGGAFAGEADELRRLLDELQRSWRIYALYQRGRYYDNNRERIGLLKRHFAGRLAAAPQAKVLLKFGSAHGGRGYSPFDQLDIGNHVAEIAVARGGDSFHVYVLARRSVDRDGVAKEMADGVESLRPFCAALPAGEGGVFDLVALRPLLSRDEIEAAHHAVHDFVFRYDALVLLPELHESEPLFALPGSR